MPSEELRRAWAEIVAPEDYETHMAAIGQAEANAHLIKHLILSLPPGPGERLLFAGAGTGQMFDYVDPDFLRPYRVTFSDIRAEFLDRIRDRLCDSAIRFELLVDDVEAPQLGQIDAAALVLVLEHVNWRQALDALAKQGAKVLYCIIQVNPPEFSTAVTPGRTLPGTLAMVSVEANPELIDEPELIEILRGHGYRSTERRPVPVADGKTMVGLVFARNA